MRVHAPKKDFHQCRLVLLQAGSILARTDDGRLQLPSVTIPQHARLADELQKAVQQIWHVTAIILTDLPNATNGIRTAVVQVCSNEACDGMTPAKLNDIDEAELRPEARGLVERILAGVQEPGQPFLRLGWEEEAKAWLQSEVGLKASSKLNLRQFNASGSFSLVKFATEDGATFWMKATGDPNRHEFHVTRRLAELCPDFLPPQIAERKDWNAWLMADAGLPRTSWSLPDLRQAVCSMAAMQKRTLGRVHELLATGASDFRLGTLRDHIPDLFNYLDGAMLKQVSTKVPRIERVRLREMEIMLGDCCLRMEVLGIPDTLLHNDINSGNILFKGERCVFTDWCEAGVGNPFLSFQLLSLLQPRGGDDWTAELRSSYTYCWIDSFDTSKAEQAYVLAPPLAILAYLYGRGSWLHSSRRYEPEFEGYARALARHLDRALQDPKLSEILCH